MNLATLIPLLVKVSIFLIGIGLGLRATPQDIISLLHRPGQLVRSMLSMMVIMPLIAAGIAAVFDLHHAVKVALIALAVSPVPPLLPKKELKAGGSASYALGLLVTAAVLAIFLVPISVEVLGKAFGNSRHISPAEVAKVVMLSVVLPFVVGITIRRAAPDFARRVQAPVTMGATVLLLVCVVPVLFTAWPAIVALIGNGTIAALAAFVIFGLVVGHMFGGPDPDDRVILALSTASRHPGVAIAIAAANFPGDKQVVAAVFLYLLVSGVVSLPYLKWHERQAGVAHPARA